MLQQNGSICTSTWIVGKGSRKPNCLHKPNSTACWMTSTSRKVQFKRAKKVWKTFRQETLGDYHHLYLKTDVCLLAYSFKNSEPYTWNSTGWIQHTTGTQCKKDRSAAGAVDRCGHASVHWARDPWWNLHGEQAVCKSQQPVCERLRPKQPKQIHSISWCE